MKLPPLALALAPSCAVLFSCSPAAEPIAKASAHYLVDFPRSPTVDGVCNETAQGAIAPDPNNTADLPLAQSEVLPKDFGELVANGGTNAIACTIKHVAGGYNVNIEMAGPNVSPTAGSATGETRLNVTNAFIGDDGIGEGSVVVSTTDTSVVAPKPTTVCLLRAIPDPQVAGAFQMRKGEARFVFTCENTTSALDDFSTCETRGTIWVDDCLDE